jgi:hypothetical protein
LALAALVACASPTLPLPPPAIPTIDTSTAAGKVHLTSRGGAEPNAIVIIINRNPTLALNSRVFGAQADGYGSWDAEVTASNGDVLEITQEIGTERSPSILVQVH